jgi:hypothetical protein
LSGSFAKERKIDKNSGKIIWREYDEALSLSSL